MGARLELGVKDPRRRSISPALLPDSQPALTEVRSLGLARARIAPILSHPIRRPRSFRISRAALWPGTPLTPPPGWAEALQR